MLQAEQNVLDLMHKHRDDVAGVPFLFLTPTRRPISRPSSRASTNSARLRPETPSSAPSSPFVHVFRRPHTPATSPLAPMASAKSDYSPTTSPVLPPASVTTQAQWTASLPASPLSSPRLLSAKASEFRPIPRPLSAAASHSPTFLLRNDTPSPDLWAHSSPRATSNLAIAAPLIADQSSAARPSTPSTIQQPSREAEEEEDPFDPFASTTQIPSFHSITVSDFDSFDSNQWPAPSDHNQTYQNPYPSTYGPGYDESNGQAGSEPTVDADDAIPTDGMTPFDVLSSVFGSTLAPSELEEALAANGYDFERAMAWLVDRALPSVPPTQGSQNNRMQNMGARVTVVSRDAMGAIRGGPNGTRGGFVPGPGPGRAPRYGNGRPVPAGGRVCRYFIAGECLRADCRFRCGFSFPFEVIQLVT